MSLHSRHVTAPGVINGIARRGSSLMDLLSLIHTVHAFIYTRARVGPSLLAKFLCEIY